MNRKAHVACNFISLVETEELLKVKGSHTHYKSGNIWETIQLRIYYRPLIGSDIWLVE